MNVSDRRRVANRLNALKSTGPRTPDGKRASSANAVRHGIFAAPPVVRVLGETEADWHAHRDAFVHALRPRGAAEATLADRAADLTWRMARGVRFQAAAAAVAYRPAAGFGDPPDGDDPGDPVTWAFSHEEPTNPRATVIAARRAARAAPDAVALFRRLADAPGDEAVAEPAVERIWSAGCQVAGPAMKMHPRELARAFQPAPAGGPTPPDALPPSVFEVYRGWTAAALRAGVGHLASLSGRPEEEFAARVADELRRAAGWWRRRAKSAEGELVRAYGAVEADGVERGLLLAKCGPRELELASRYEAHLSRELARTLRLLESLQAARRRGGKSRG